MCVLDLGKKSEVELVVEVQVMQFRSLSNRPFKAQQRIQPNQTAAIEKKPTEISRALSKLVRLFEIGGATEDPVNGSVVSVECQL